MIAAYIAVTILAASAYAYAAYMNFVRHESVVAAAERVRVPQSWMLPLGSLLAVGALGLLVGFAVPAIGTAAAAGLVVYFLIAVGAHVRVRDQVGTAAIFLMMAVAALSVSLAYRGLS
jgi:DoxX-like protein